MEGWTDSEPVARSPLHDARRDRSWMYPEQIAVLLSPVFDH